MWIKFKTEGQKEADKEVDGRYPLGSPLLGALTLVVDAAEVRHDHRHRQGDDQHPTQRADGPKHLPHDCFWHHVTVPETQRNRRQSTRGVEKQDGWREKNKTKTTSCLIVTFFFHFFSTFNAIFNWS